MAKITGSTSAWDFVDLENDIVRRIIKLFSGFMKDQSPLSEEDAIESALREILERLVNCLPNGEILSDGYFKGFKPATNGHKPTCKDMREVLALLGDAYDVNINALSSSEHVLIRLMQTGGSWAWRVYQAIPDIIDPLLRRIVKEPE